MQDGRNEVLDVPNENSSLPQRDVGAVASDSTSRFAESSIRPPEEVSTPPHRRLRIAFVCAGDPEDLLTWSGTPHHMLRVLRLEFDVSTVVRRPWPTWAHAVRRLVRRATRGQVDLTWSPLWSRLVAAQAIRDIKNARCDAVFVVGVTPIGAELVDEVPTVFVSDATLARMLDYNPRFSSLLPGLKRSAWALEDRCIQKSILSLLPSEWASSSAVADHGGSPDRVVCVPWGANMRDTMPAAPEARSTTSWRLLFVGTNWFGKGGDIALETIRIMRSQGYDVHLDVVGSAPEVQPDMEGVTFHGFLNKQNPSDAARIDGLFAQAHVFFLPTQFEALGIVFAEAASLAMPAVSYATGGVPGMVQHNVTGILLEEGAPPKAFARALIDLLSDRLRYLDMCHAALENSRNSLNWEAWARRAREELEKRLATQ